MLRYQKLISLLIATNANVYVSSFPSLTVKSPNSEIQVFSPCQVLVHGTASQSQCLNSPLSMHICPVGSTLPQTIYVELRAKHRQSLKSSMLKQCLKWRNSENSCNSSPSM